MAHQLPPLSAVRAFEAVARHEHLGHAAEELNVSQSAVSQQIKVRENCFGIDLFERGRGHLRLKSGGEKLAKGYSAAFEKLVEATKSLSEEEDENIVIYCDPVFYTKSLTQKGVKYNNILRGALA